VIIVVARVYLTNTITKTSTMTMSVIGTVVEDPPKTHHLNHTFIIPTITELQV